MFQAGSRAKTTTLSAARASVSVRSSASADVGEQIRLVQDGQDRSVAHAELAEHAADDVRPLGGARRPDVDHMQEQVRRFQLFERRAETPRPDPSAAWR